MTDDHVPAKADIVERLHTIRAHLRTGRFGQREVWEEWLIEAADTNERLRAALQEIEHETGQTMLATNHGRRGDIANALARRALEPKP